MKIDILETSHTITGEAVGTRLPSISISKKHRSMSIPALGGISGQEALQYVELIKIIVDQLINLEKN